MLYHLYISLTAITMAFSVLKLDISNSRSSTELNKDSDDRDSQDQGGFTYDKLSEVFTLQWPTMQDFTGWLEEEQRRNCYELNLQKKDKARDSHASSDMSVAGKGQEEKKCTQS